MLFTRFASSGLMPALLLGRALLAQAAVTKPYYDPCVKVAGQIFVDTADALACQKSFPFNETLRQNVLAVVSRVLDFYTYEAYYLDSPLPFQESTTNIREGISRINSTQYATDYDFNLALWTFLIQLNDGHTLWHSGCYNSHHNVLPAPVVLLDKDVFIAPDSVEMLTQLGENFTSLLAAKDFDWQSLAGARVIDIGGRPARQYIDEIAHNFSGNFLDHNIRVNSVVSSYRIFNTSLSFRLGDLASRQVLQDTSLKFSLIPANSTSDKPVEIDVPFIAAFFGANFTDGKSYWANNCAANNLTNGVDRRSSSADSSGNPVRLARALIHKPDLALDLPGSSSPTLNPTNGSAGVIKSYVLPGNKTGVMFVGSFLGDFGQFQVDVEAAVNELKASGVTNLLIDVTDNGGGYVLLGLFLHLYLAGKNVGYPGFQSTSRANPLAQKIVKAAITQGLDAGYSFYSGGNWLFLNGTSIPADYNYNSPSVPFTINNFSQPTSQRFEDLLPTWNVTIPETPPFNLSNVAIIGNGFCASTCALFTTVMFERHQTKIATFGGDLNKSMEFKGMAGNEVLEWADLNSEIKTVGLKNDTLSPPDLLVDGNMRHNWRTAYSYFDESAPLGYRSERPQYRFPYTKETYISPPNLWTFAEEKIFGTTPS